MIHEQAIHTSSMARVERSQPIVVGHWALFSLFLLWLTLLASAFNLGLNLS